MDYGLWVIIIRGEMVLKNAKDCDKQLCLSVCIYIHCKWLCGDYSEVLIRAVHVYDISEQVYIMVRSRQYCMKCYHHTRVESRPKEPGHGP